MKKIGMLFAALLLFGCGNATKGEYVPSNEEIVMLMKPFDSRNVMGGSVSLIPRFYYYDETGEDYLQKPEISNLEIVVGGEIVYDNSDGEGWTSFDTSAFENGEYVFSATAVSADGYVWSFETNCFISNFYVPVTVTLSEPLQSEWQQLYLCGSSTTFNVLESGDWDPKSLIMEREDETTFTAQVMAGMYEKLQFQVTLGNWGTKAKREDGEDLITTVKITNSEQTVEIAVDNWGSIKGTLSARGYVIGFTDDAMMLEIAYTHPEETNITMYYSYGGEWFDSVQDKNITNYSFFEIYSRFAFNTELYFVFSDHLEETNSMKMPYNNVPFTFIVMGDLQNTESDISSVIAENETNVSFVLDVGDLVMHGYDLTDWNEFFTVKQTGILTNFLYQPVPGNHEEQSPLYFAITGKEDYYSYRWANSYFIALNGNSPYQEGSPQYEWLKTELSTQARYSSFVFVYVHYTPYSTRKHGSDVELRETLCPLFEEYGVDVVLSGHNHGYEVSYPLTDGEIDEENGVIYATLGGANPNLYDTYGDIPEWQRMEKKTNYYTRVSVTTGEATFEVIDLDTLEVFDTFTVYK